eukprot:g157.t1
MALTVRCEIISDTVCPWCFLGKRRLESAIANICATDSNAGAGVHFEPLRWKPWLLNPSLGTEGIPRRNAYLALMGGNERKVASMERKMNVMFKAEGASFSLDGTMGNTINSHRLLAAAGRGELSTRIDPLKLQNALVEVLFKLYFARGQNLAQRDVLLAAAKEAGADTARAAEALDTRVKDGVREVLHDIRDAAAIEGVTGVPHFILSVHLAECPALDEGEGRPLIRFALPGAQEVPVFAQVLRKLIMKAQAQRKMVMNSDAARL